MFDFPAGLLCHRIPCQELAADRAVHLTPDAEIGWQVTCSKIEAHVEPSCHVRLPVCLGGIDRCRFEGRDENQIFAGMIGHRMPVMATQRPRHNHRWLACNIDAGFRILDRPTGCIDAFGPGLRDVLLGADKFAGFPIEHIEEPVLGSLHQDFSLRTLDFHIGQDDVLGRRVIPGFAGRGLVMPDIFPGIRSNRDDRGKVEVVALALSVGPGAAIGAVPG